MQLRPYQSQLVSEVWTAWNGGARNVVMRLDTGGGKTVIFSELVQGWNGGVALIAHRQELVSQLSLTLARYGVRHNIIATPAVRRAIAALHLATFGRCYFDPASRVAVASVDTLNRAQGLEGWLASVTLWVVDEGHHVVRDNKWHTAISKFTNPHVHGLLPTATPGRADGKGLGVHADGVAHAMVQGPPMRWLIDKGYLSDYRIICPESDLVMYEEAGASGDWSSKQLKDASKRSHIIGDVVREYLRWAPGKLGITFTTDIETAAQMTEAYRRAGVLAECLTGKTDDGYRRQILRNFETRQITQIVAVDIVSEGFDLPALEVASLARPTQSLALYMQQFGRALRPMEGKSHALILDHAGNTLRHQGPPDKPRAWTLDRKTKRNGAGGIPLRVCLGCWQPYPRTAVVCPYCGTTPPPPEARTSAAAVDGDLTEMDPATLAQLRGAVAHSDLSTDDYRNWLQVQGVNGVIYLANVKRHVEKQEAQLRLRQRMGEWGYPRHAAGATDREIQREFWFTFGMDVLTAMALGASEADALAEKVARQ